MQNGQVLHVRSLTWFITLPSLTDVKETSGLGSMQYIWTFKRVERFGFVFGVKCTNKPVRKLVIIKSISSHWPDMVMMISSTSAWPNLDTIIANHNFLVHFSGIPDLFALVGRGRGGEEATLFLTWPKIRYPIYDRCGLHSHPKHKFWRAFVDSVIDSDEKVVSSN